MRINFLLFVALLIEELSTATAPVTWTSSSYFVAGIYFNMKVASSTPQVLQVHFKIKLLESPMDFQC